MPTFSAVIGTKKKDNTFSVSIQITQYGEKKYIPSAHYATKSQLTGKLKLKDQKLIKKINDIIEKYRDRVLDMPDLNKKSAAEIKEFLSDDQRDGLKYLDFVAYGRTFIKTQKESTGKNTEVALNSFIHFYKYDTIQFRDITVKLLTDYATYLLSERKITVVDKSGKETTRVLKPATTTGARDYIGKLRQIFIAARLEYNDEDSGKIIIANYPFAKFKMPKYEVAKKRNVKADIIKTIRDTPSISKKADMGRDIFMLSFYLIGINTVDLFEAKELKKDRLLFNRAKTASRRVDKAFTSIKVEPEAMYLINKYRDPSGKRLFVFWQWYSNSDNFSRAIRQGLNTVCAEINKNGVITEEKITPYYARHSWATIARNVCKISKSDIATALNHSDPSMKVTDLYIEDDFGVIDDINRKVLDVLL